MRTIRSFRSTSSKGEQKRPSSCEINPAGKLPALVDGEARLFENAAICLYLADRFPEAKLAPKIGAPERGRYLALMVYSTSQLEPAMGDAMLGVKTERIARLDRLRDRARTSSSASSALDPYLLGERFTAADVMIGAVFIWSRMMGTSSGRTAIEAYADRLLARPKAIKLGG